MSVLTAPFLGVVSPRQRFINEMLAVAPCRLLWTPRRGDTQVIRSLDRARRSLTWNEVPGTRISKQGQGAVQAFSSSHFATIPDAGDLSFGDGTVDQPFSVVALANVTDTAAAKRIVAKYDSGTNVREWLFQLTSAEILGLTLRDQSVGVEPGRTSNAAIAAGALTLLGASYSGLGGATAANGITLYVNGAVVASTPSNQATYVSMEDTATAVSIGASLNNGAATSAFTGSLGFVAVYAVELTAAQHRRIRDIARRYFGVAL
jgi:hypothetical protein